MIHLHQFTSYFWLVLIVLQCLSCDFRISNEIQPPLEIYTFPGSQFKMWDVLKKNNYLITSSQLNLYEQTNRYFSIYIPDKKNDTITYSGYFIGPYELWLNEPDTCGFTIMAIHHRGKHYSKKDKNNTKSLIKSEPYLRILEKSFISPLRIKFKEEDDYTVKLIKETSRGNIFTICKDSISCDTVRLVGFNEIDREHTVISELLKE